MQQQIDTLLSPSRPRNPRGSAPLFHCGTVSLCATALEDRCAANTSQVAFAALAWRCADTTLVRIRHYGADVHLSSHSSTVEVPCLPNLARRVRLMSCVEMSVCPHRKSAPMKWCPADCRRESHRSHAAQPRTEPELHDHLRILEHGADRARLSTGRFVVGWHPGDELVFFGPCRWADDGDRLTRVREGGLLQPADQTGWEDSRQ